MNSIVIKGRLTRDPELKTVQIKGDDKAVCNFSVAVDRRFGEETDFFDVAAWGKTAEFVDKYFVKGQEVLVRGSMQRRNYKDKEGNKRVAWDLRAEEINFCGSKRDKPAGEKENNYHVDANGEVQPGPGPQDEDIPF
jgi:single-strand DNA-binding protein